MYLLAVVSFGVFIVGLVWIAVMIGMSLKFSPYGQQPIS